MFNNFYNSAAQALSGVPFDTFVWILWGSFAAVFVLSVIICLAVRTAKNASKRPFFCLVCAYTAATFALYITKNPVEDAAFCASVFWLAGYLCYGALCLFGRARQTPRPAAAPSQTINAMPVVPKPPVKSAPPEGVARNNVRLEHALAVTDKLLAKNLGKTDRQELEKLKSTLEVLKIKGTLTPAEGEILNENFNTLLKLMAKYNI